MELVITKEFLEEFFVCHLESDSIHSDFIKFINEHVKNIRLITNFSDVDEMKQVSDDNIFWEFIIERGISELDLICDLQNEIQNTSFYQNRTYPFKFFFVDLDKDTCLELSKKFGYEYINFEILSEKWKNYRSEREDYHLAIDSISNPRFDNWDKLLYFKHPINSIVVFDKYLFCELNQYRTQQWSIDDNLMKIFKNLLDDKSNLLPLDLSIIITKENIKPASSIPSGLSKLEYVHNRIKNFFNSNFPSINVNISIIHYDKKKHTSEKEHGRGVYTNYFYIFIEQGINIFNCSGQIINNSHISYFFPFRSVYTNIVMSKLKNFKTYLNDINSYLIANPSERGNYIYGSGNNRLVEGI